MRVTDFNMTKAGRVALYIDDVFRLSMHPDVFAASGISVGDEVDEEYLEELSAEAELKKAKEKALSMLSYKEYTSGELAQRLRRHVDAQAADDAVERMEQLGLLNDADYAQRFARDLSVRRKYGILRVRQEMRRKGLDPALIEEALAELAENDPQEKIRAILDKKYPLADEDEQVRRRAYAALLRLGYTSSEVRSALSRDEYYD